MTDRAVDPRLLWLALGGFIGANEGFLIGSLLPAISEDTGVTIGTAGLIVSGHALAYALGTPVLSALLGRLDRRTVLVGGELAFAFFAVLIALAQSFEWVLAARIGLAFGVGLFTATAYGTAVALSPPERRGRAVGTVAAGQSFALVVGVPTSAYLAANVGWHTIYGGIGVLAASSAIAMWFLLPPRLSGDPRSLSDRVSVLTIRGVPMALLLTLLFMAGSWMPLTFIAPLAEHAAGLGRNVLPIVLLANGAGAFAGGIFGGRIADRLGARRTVLITSLASALVLTAFWVTPSLPSSMVFAVFLVLMGLSGFVGWSYWAAHNSMLGSYAPASAPLLVALNLTALNIGVTISAALGGRVLDSVGAWALPAAALLFGGAALVLVLWSSTRREPRLRVGTEPNSG